MKNKLKYNLYSFLKIFNSPWVWFFVILIFYILFQSNSLKSNWPTWNSGIQDEVHTILYGNRGIYGGEIDLRIAASTRRFVQILSPIAIIFMNSKLGGEHIAVGEFVHDYTGFNYLVRNLDYMGMKQVVLDYNLQNYRYMLVFLRNTIFILLVLFLAKYLYDNYSKLGSLFLIYFSIFNNYYLSESNYFYTDFTNYILYFALFYLFVYKFKNRLSFIFALSIVSAFLISNTVANLVFIPFIGIYVILTFKPSLKEISLISFCIGILFLIINIKELEYPRAYFDEQVWNLWHYSNGHGHIYPNGLDMFMRIYDVSGPYIILLAISPLVIIFCKDSVLRNFSIFNALFGFLIIFFGSGLRFFDPRNTSLIFAVGIVNIFLIVFVVEQKINIENNLPVYLMLLALLLKFSLSTDSFSSKEMDSVIKESSCKNVAVSEVDLNYPRLSSIYIYEPIHAQTYLDNIKEEIDTKGFDCIVAKDVEINKQLLHVLNLQKTIVSEVSGKITDSGRENINFNFIIVENKNDTVRYLIPKNVKSYVSSGSEVQEKTELYFGLNKEFVLVFRQGSYLFFQSNN